MPSPIDRAIGYAQDMYPAAEIVVRNYRGRPILLAIEDNLIRLVKYEIVESHSA